MKSYNTVFDVKKEDIGTLNTYFLVLFLEFKLVSATRPQINFAPQSNGFVERLHRTMLDEHFRIQGRKKWYESVEEMQQDLDVYLSHYNKERTHQGRNMNGRTPYQAFVDGLPKKESKKAA